MLIINQDITTVEEGLILQVCNIKGGYGRGVAEAIASTYPKVKTEYKKLYKADGLKLGTIQPISVTDRLTVINMFAMFDYRRTKQDTKRYLSYLDLVKCLSHVNEFNYPTKQVIYIPYLMGCGNGGGDWDIVTAHIHSCLEPGNKVIICKLP